MTNLCTVPGCPKPSRGKHYCSAHYQRWLRHSDPLGGRFNRGEARKFFYDVVVPYDGDDCLVWPFHKNRNGYPTIKIDRQKLGAHRQLCIFIHGEPPSLSHQAAHSCGNRACVNKRHISWKTPLENSADKYLHGTVIHGEQHVASKLTEADVREIRALHGKVAVHQLAKQFHVDQALVSRVIQRKIWSHVE